MIWQEGNPTSSGTRTRGRTLAAVLGVLTLLAAAVGARGVGSSAQAAPVADLAQLRDRAVAFLDRAQIKGSTGYSVGIDPSRQRIGVYLFTAPGASPPDLVGLRASLGADADLHAVTGTLHPVGHIWGGEPVRIPGGLDCTLGFAIGLRDGRQGFLTSGHCFDTTRPANQQHGHTVDGVSMTGLEYKYIPSDWGILTLDNATDVADGEVFTAPENHPVRAVAAPTFGMAICKSGVTTQTTCGKITLVDTEATTTPVIDHGVIVEPSQRFTGLIMNDLCAEDGDSGAPVYTTPAQGQNAPVDAVGIMTLSDTRRDVATGEDLCLEKFNGPGTNVAYALPLAAISAATTNPFTVKTSS